MWQKIVFSIILGFMVVNCEQVPRQPDSGAVGTDFLHFPPIQYSPHRVFQGPVDLTALQQTHVLGNFHHRFHPTRVNYPFGSNPSQVLFVPQTHITPPQDQRSAPQGPVLRGAHQESQRSAFISPQDPLASHNQNLKILTSKAHSQFPTNQDQSIKNSFPSNAPHTIKFSISSQNYNPTQVRHLSNSGTPPPKITHQLTPNLSQGRFNSAPQAPQPRPLTNPDFHNLQSTNQFTTPFNKDRNNYQNFNIHTQKHSFATSQVSSAPDVSSNSHFTSGTISNFNFRQGDFQQTNEIPPAPFGKKSNPNSDPRFNGGSLRTPEPQLHSPLIQSSIELKQDDLIHQQKQQTLEGGLNFPKIPNQQSFLQSTPQPHFEYTSSPPETNPQPKSKFTQNVSQKYFEYQTTDSTQRTRVVQHEGSLDSRRTLASNSPALPGPGDRKLTLHKSQNHLQYTLPENYLNKKHSSEGGSTPLRPSPTATTTLESFTTISTTYRNPKPVVKEITINLNDHKISEDDISSQLYIKENRQKEFDAIKAKEEKEGRKKNEKTQEELINEQIQKLLQSHNLEIIGKDSEAQTNSQEVQLSKVSEQFKKYNYSVQLLNGGGLLSDLKPKLKASKTSTALPPLPDLPDHIKKQYDIKLVHKDELLKQFDLYGNHDLGNTTSNLFLANGQKLEIVNFSKDGIMNKIPIGTKAVSDHPPTITTTAKPPKVLFEELTKQVLPPGANFDIIKHKGDGQVEKVEGLTAEKKVTFVFLEEQPDGSVKIQGVKGNTNEEGDDNEDVDSLIKKIKNGSLKLPPSQDHQSTKSARLRGNEVTRFAITTEKGFGTVASRLSTTPPTDPPSPSPETDFAYSSPYSVDLDHRYTSSYYETTPDPPTTFLPTLNYIRSSTRKPSEKTKSNYSFLPTVPTVDTPTFGSRKLKTTPSPSWYRDAEDNNAKPQHHASVKSYSRHTSSDSNTELLSHRSTEYRSQRIRLPQDVIAEESSIRTIRPLDQVLKENGLNEMAKFLDQSGLNSILNETGPYTIFIPTDKAFKTLEAQLGGPEKAEDKFRENPRLLSGLLLHHVVPGSFRVEDLQDEMTGVSLAGTQLRVNAYATDDKRSNGHTLVTINGAKVSDDKKDIVVPQGLAHSIDRVLFPLPIGDIVQTLKNDREKRFTKFLKSLEYSGLTDMLTGSKTYTVFAPTDKAFSVLTDAELEKLLTRREAAKTIVLRHIMPGTLYTAGMHYFQVKDSMETGQKITIKKELGKVKANSAQIVSANIPATNGVIHAVETLL